jgi:hypothetical protein
MAFTKSDVSDYKQVNGKTVILTDDEKQAIADSWNAEPGNSYSENRREAYPSIGDQLDMLWHAIDVGDWNAVKVKTTSFYTELKAVKDANPKP